MVAALGERAEAIGIKHGRYPYGPNVYVDARLRMLDWAEENSLTYVPSERYACVQWLLGLPCRRARCYATTTGRRHWSDHLSGWLRDGRPAVLVAQPYVVTAEGEESLSYIGEHPLLSVERRPSGWYGNGTGFVGVWRTDA